MSDTPQSSPKSESIIAVPQVLERRRRQKKLTKITSNGTIAAAVMVGAALLAVIVANSDAYEAVHHFLMEPLTLGIGPLVGSISIEAFVNDFLMAIFF